MNTFEETLTQYGSIKMKCGSMRIIDLEESLQNQGYRGNYIDVMLGKINLAFCKPITSNFQLSLFLVFFCGE